MLKALHGNKPSQGNDRIVCARARNKHTHRDDRIAEPAPSDQIDPSDRPTAEAARRNKPTQDDDPTAEAVDSPSMRRRGARPTTPPDLADQRGLPHEQHEGTVPRSGTGSTCDWT